MLIWNQIIHYNRNLPEFERYCNSVIQGPQTNFNGGVRFETCQTFRSPCNINCM